MKPTPRGWPRISTGIVYKEAGKAIDWLASAFGFEVVMKIEGEGGRIEHSELKFGDGLVMVGEEAAQTDKNRSWRKSPVSIGGANTQTLFIYVDDVVAHCARARAAGAKIITEPKVTDYGEDYWADKSYECEDFEGHHWWFAERLRSHA